MKTVISVSSFRSNRAIVKKIMPKWVLFALFALCVGSVLSAPTEENIGVNQRQKKDTEKMQDSDANKINSTRQAQIPKDNKDMQIPLSFPYQQWPYYSYQPQQPLMATPYLAAYNTPQYFQTAGASPFWFRGQGKSVEGKTFGHLKNLHRGPLYYQAQPLYYQQYQPQFYSVPVQSYYSSLPVQSYSPHYEQGPAYISYPLSTHGNQYYKFANGNQNQEKPSPDEVKYLGGNVGATFVSKIPTMLEYQLTPADAESVLPVSRPQSPARDASSVYGITTLPMVPEYSPIDQLRKHDVVIDDNYNMQFKPSYLMDRLRLDSLKRAMPLPKDAEESSFGNMNGMGGHQSYQIPAANPEDQVFVVMNPYEQSIQNAGARTDARADENGWFDQAGADQQALGSQYLAADQTSDASAAAFTKAMYFNPPPKQVPFSQENIQNYMQSYYLDEYNRQLASSNKYQNFGTDSSRSPGDKIPAGSIYDVIQQLSTAKSKRPTDDTPNTADEKPKADQKNEKQTSEEKNEKPKQQ